MMKSSIQQRINPFWDSSGTLSPLVVQLLAILNIEHDGTIPTLIEVTQKNFLRPPDQERWQISEKYPEKRLHVLEILSALGMIKEIAPLDSQYEYALLPGQLLSRVKIRINHLLSLWNQGIRFNTLVVLSGARQLDPHEEAFEPRFKNAKTEFEMIKIIFEQIDMPDELRALPTVFIDTPQQQTVQGTLRRPNTADTILQWLHTNPVSGSCLIISNQPFIGYQHAVFKTLLPKHFTAETVGSKAPEHTLLAEYLDNLARWMYVEYLGNY